MTDRMELASLVTQLNDGVFGQDHASALEAYFALDNHFSMVCHFEVGESFSVTHPDGQSIYGYHSATEVNVGGHTIVFDADCTEQAIQYFTSLC